MTDLFKFVAIRPPQRVTENETHRTIIRDERKASPDGVQLLVLLARKLASPDTALGRWREFDLSPLAALSEAYRVLLHRYEEMNKDVDPPAGLSLLNQLGITLPRDSQLRKLRELAWDALYTADRTGPDAGPRLEVPMAVLRILHFGTLLDVETNPTRSSALVALRATPEIPTAFFQGIPEGPVPPQVAQPVAGTSDTPLQPSSRSIQLRKLAQELHASEQLFEMVTTAPALAMQVIKTGSVEKEAGLARSQFSVGTVPNFRSALAAQFTSDQTALLGRLRITEATPVPVAARTIQSHLTKLSEQVNALGDDQEFWGLMREQDMVPGISLGREQIGKPESWSSLAALDDPGEVPDVDVSGRITPLGIGDLKVVKQTLLAYLPGEVAHIENVLKGESKERKHRKLDRSETTLFTSEEETKETQRDTQTTDRFELKREAEQTIKEDMSIKAGLNVTAAYGPVVTTATGDFAYSTSKQDSQKSSSNFAREVVDHSVSKVQTKTKTERTTKTLSEVEEINNHALDNTTPGTAHITGIYRWVDKQYRAQVYNYGVRLLLEFVVPEPAAFYRAAQLGRTLKDLNATPPPPFINILTGQPLTVKDISDSTYQQYVSRYNAAGVTPPPPQFTYAGTAIVDKGNEYGKAIGVTTKDFVVPEGYTLNYYSLTISLLWGHVAQFSVQVGRDVFPILEVPHSHPDAPHIINQTQGVPEEVKQISGAVQVSVSAYDVRAFAVNVQGSCVRTPEYYAKWQLQTFDKIAAAFQALQTAYDQKVAQAQAAAGITILGQNPGMNRVVEKTELKKLCITMMTGQHFKQFNAMTDPADKPRHHPEVIVGEALAEGRIVQFFEQAFEWEQMTYLYYPYFWGRKRNWVEITHLTDPDPLFVQFLTAGAARVVVPVPIAYVESVQYLLQSKETNLGKKVWGGGERPTIEDPLYVSIAEEMRNQTDDLAGAAPEGEPWEFTLPTTLVWLQPDSSLPKFI